MRSFVKYQVATILLLGFIDIAVSHAHCRLENCVVIQQCPGLYRLLMAPHRDYSTYELLNSKNCGYEQRYPKVCCTDSEKYYGQTPSLPKDFSSPKVSNENNFTTYSGEETKKLLPDNCGLSLSNRIVGGTITDIDEFPWMALLEYRTNQDVVKTLCGGSLISRRYVLTAAHCIRSIPKTTKLVSVRLGEYDTSKQPDCVPNGASGNYCADEPISVDVEEQIVHENYKPDGTQLYNDVALLRLSRDVNFTDFVQPICLPNGKGRVNEGLTVAGWGKTENRKSSDVKLKVAVPFVRIDDCSERYKKTRPLILNTSSQICAGGKTGKDSCTGDSGGPLMQETERPKYGPAWEAVGVVSFGPATCGETGTPGVYSNVNYFMPWILDKLKP